jgi:bud emergence protein 1
MNQEQSGRGSAHQPTQLYRSSQQQQPRLLAPISASLPRYCVDNDMYWYIIECQMEDGKHWELSRYYADFYDFQIALLEAFPEEAGNKGRPRTLPFMPGPVAHVTDAISNGRRQILDEYIRKILSTPPHISKCQLVRQFFAPRPGDFEIDPKARGDDYRLSGASSQHRRSQTDFSTAPVPPAGLTDLIGQTQLPD